jgi:hypothetical protein
MEVEPFGFAADASLYRILLLANAEQHHSFSCNFFSNFAPSKRRTTPFILTTPFVLAQLFLILLLANAEQHHSFSCNYFSSGSASTGNKGKAGVLLLVTKAKVNRSKALRIVILSPLCVKRVFPGVLLLVTRAKRGQRLVKQGCNWSCD